MNEAEREAHYRQMKSMMAWGGWVLAFAALFLGGHLLTKMNDRINFLKTDNAALRAELAALKTPGADPRQN